MAGKPTIGRWRHEIAYALLAIAVVIALVGYQRHVSNQLRAADDLSCINRRLLTANQRLVLGFLYRNTAQLADLHGSTEPYFRRTHRDVGIALRNLATTPTCKH